MTHLQALSLIVALGFWLLVAIILLLFIMIGRLRKDLEEVITWARSVGKYMEKPRVVVLPKDKEPDNG